MLSLDSPKVSPSQFAFVNIKKADGRRWSVASLPRYIVKNDRFVDVFWVPIEICYDNMDSTAVAVMARPQDQATYPVNVLVRFVRSWIDLSHLNVFLSGEASSACSPPSSQWTANNAQVI